MRAFFVGLLFLICVFILAGIGILFFPLLLVMAWFLRLILAFIFIVFSIWLLGKFIIFVWEKLRQKEAKIK